MKQAIKWYVLSNVHIALCAIFFLIGGFSLFQVEINIALLSFLGIGTWIIYVLHRYIGGRQLSKKVNEERFDVARWPKKIFFSVVIIAVVCEFVSLYYIPKQLYIPLSILGLVSASYIAPLFGGGRRLRDIGKLKIFLISIVWAGVFILPYWLSNQEFDKITVFTIWLEKALFIFALTLPFDIRDRHLDEASKVSTIASMFSDIIILRIVTTVLLLCLSLIGVHFFQGTYSMMLSTGLISLIMLQWILSNMTLKPRSEIFFLGLLDSFILFQGLIHCLK